MRVLHIYSGNMFGGIENLLVTLARHRGSDPTVEHCFALCFEGRLSRELRECQAPVALLGPVRGRYPWTIWSGRRRLDKYCRSIGCDVAILHSEWPMALFGAVARRWKVPIVFWNHSFVECRLWFQRWARWIVPDLAISTSQVAEATLAHLYPSTRSVCIYPVLPLEPLPMNGLARSQLRRQFDTPDDSVVILQSSRLEEYKGHRLLLRALALMRDNPRWICWIAGGVQQPRQQTYLNDLQRIAARTGILDRIRFLGERSDIPTVLMAADIHCQPNTQPEPFGICFVEALACRLPVVTTNIGGAIEIVDDTCGRLVSPDDEQALSTALLELIDDTALRRQLGAGGPSRAQQLCDPQRQIRRLHQVLESLV